MIDRPEKHSVTAAKLTIASLDARAADVRAELLRLRAQLHDVQSDLSETRSVQLQEANEKLVLAVLQADSIADEAVANLAALSASSQRDGLTGLPNRALGLDRLTNAIDMARRHGKRLAVLFLDLDYFKEVNDQLGHANGDQLLQLVTKRLRSVLRDSDTISRYGGDEFLILLPDVSAASDVGPVARELLAAIIAPGSVGGHTLQQSASLGISLYPDDGEDAPTLIGRADAAMYRSKRRGAGGFQFHAQKDVGEDPHDLRMHGFQPSSTSPVDESASSTARQRDLRDANERLVMAALLAQESEAQARNAHREQMKFMALVAHELRSPLTPLCLATEMLTHRNVSDDAPLNRLKVIITTQVARMTRLIDDLLEGSRLSTGKLRLEFDSVELVALLDRVIMACQPGMQARQQHLNVELPPGPINMRGDPIRLGQIFHNLLDNARKYTPEGGQITLGMTLADRSVSVSVRDNGVGIEPEMLSRIFEMFVQETRVFSHSSAGLGIGLAIVRNLVEAHGGTVVAHSAGRDLGSEFVVTLPLC